MSQIKEKAPETAATVQSAQVNNQVQDTISQEKMQELHSAFWNIGSGLETLSFEQEKILDLLSLLDEHLEYESTLKDPNDISFYAPLLLGRIKMFTSLLRAIIHLTDDSKNQILKLSSTAYEEGGALS